VNPYVASDSWSRGVRHVKSYVEVRKSSVQKNHAFKLWQLCKTL